MANEFGHVSVGLELTQSEWEAPNTHAANNQTANDLLYFDGSVWKRTAGMQFDGTHFYTKGRIYPGTGAAIQTGSYITSAAAGVPDYGRIFMVGGDFFGLRIEAVSETMCGAALWLIHNSASPAAGDEMAMLIGLGKNSIGTYKIYSEIETLIDDPTNASEDSHFEFDVYNAGTQVNAMEIRGDAVHTRGRIYPGSGAAIQVARYLYDDGYRLHLIGPNPGAGLTLETTYSGATGPYLLLHANSPSPAVNDAVGTLLFQGRDLTPGDRIYASIQANIIDPSAGAATGKLSFVTEYNNVENLSMELSYIALQIFSYDPGSTGALVVLNHDSGSPAPSDAVGTIGFLGRNSVGGQVYYGTEGVQIVDPTSGSEDSRFLWSAYAAGVFNSAMILTGDGLLSVDATGAGTPAQVDLFDDVDDLALIEQVRRQGDLQPFLDLGILSKKEDSSGSGYFLNLQTAHWFTFDAIRQLAYRLQALERDNIELRRLVNAARA